MIMKLQPRLTYANVIATAALFIALGGGAYAATKLPANSVGTKQIKKNAVNGTKVRDNSLTGSDVNESKLGVVPSASNALSAANATDAQNASSAANAAQLGGAPASSYAQKGDLQPEALHTVSNAIPTCENEPGTFCGQAGSGGWFRHEGGYADPAFRRDSGGFVHLQGTAERTSFVSVPTIFYLPQGYRPTDGTHEFIAQKCGGGSGYVDIQTDGAVTPGSTGNTDCLSLDGITFHP